MSSAYTQGEVFHADESTFEQEVIRSDVPVLVDFYADWCGPCKMIAPVLEEVAREIPAAKVVKVDVDANPELASRYGISSIPTLMLFRDGVLLFNRPGMVPPAALEDLVTQVEGLDMEEVRQKIAEEEVKASSGGN